MINLFAGLDVSTQGCKLVVINHGAGEIVFVHSVNYDSDLPQYSTRNGVIQSRPAGVSESEPGMWIEAVDVCFERCRDAGVTMDRIMCISVSGQQHGLVALDGEGNLTRPASKLWNDFSTLEECEIMTAQAGGLEDMIAEVGNSQRTGYTASKIFNMIRHEPDIYARTRTLFLVHNYINFYLTGGVRVMEPGDTSGMALWNAKTGNWSEKVINAIDPLLRNKLPEVRPSNATIGLVTDSLVEKFGFSANCRIDAGSGDNMYGAVGTGNVEPGIVTISLGTSGTAYTFLEEAFIDPQGEIALFCDSTGHYLPLLCVSNMANGYNEILELYNLTHEAFANLIGKTSSGNGGRLLIPWYKGERTPDVPRAAPIYFGFGLDDFTLENLCRAVLEGHVLNLYDGFRKMPVEVQEIRLTGGLSRSPVWCQMIADIFEADTVPVLGEGAALGAALHAAWVWCNENKNPISIKEVVTPFIILEEDLRKKPVDANVSVYRTQKQLFASLSRSVRGLDAEDPFELRAKIFSGNS